MKIHPTNGMIPAHGSAVDSHPLHKVKDPDVNAITIKRRFDNCPAAGARPPARHIVFPDNADYLALLTLTVAAAAE